MAAPAHAGMKINGFQLNGITINGTTATGIESGKIVAVTLPESSGSAK